MALYVGMEVVGGRRKKNGKNRAVKEIENKIGLRDWRWCEERMKKNACTKNESETENTRMTCLLDILFIIETVQRKEHPMLFPSIFPLI